MYDDEDNDYYEYDDAYDHYMHTGELSEWFEDEQEEILEEHLDDTIYSLEKQIEEEEQKKTVHKNTQQEVYLQPQKQTKGNNKKQSNNSGCLEIFLCMHIPIFLIIITLYTFS